MYSKILVGVDGKAGGRDAIAMARELVAPDGTLELAHVYFHYPPTGSRTTSIYETGEPERAMKLLHAAQQATGVQAELHVISARDVGSGLRALAESIGADLIVIGATRRSRIRRALLGDHAAGASSGPACPVEIAPPGHAQAHAGVGAVGTDS